MPRRSLLRQSWDETRDVVSSHPRATAWGATALALVVVSAAIGLSRQAGDAKPKTTLRADESAASVSTPTTFFGNDIIENPNHKARSGDGTPSASGNTTDFTIRSGNGFHLYTGPAPDYATGGKKTTTTNANGDGEGAATNTTLPAGVGNGGGGAENPKPFPAAVFAANRIAYVVNGQTWTVNPDGTDARFVATSAYYPAWAPQHAAIAVVESQNPGGILSFITQAGGRYALTAAPDSNGDGDSRPTWSPDGQRLAFGRIDFQGSGGYSSIWVINKDGQNLKRISVAGCFTADPAWSPDGSSIAFWSSRDHCSGGDNIGSYELYVMRSDGTKVTRIGTAVNSGAPAWSPDGSQIAFSSDRDGNFEIYTMNADGSAQTRLTTSSADDTDPSWSPDGERIAFSRNNTIYTMKRDGTDAKTVVAGSQPSWS